MVETWCIEAKEWAPSYRVIKLSGGKMKDREDKKGGETPMVGGLGESEGMEVDLFGDPIGMCFKSVHLWNLCCIAILPV